MRRLHSTQVTKTRLVVSESTIVISILSLVSSFILFQQVHRLDNKTAIHIQVPASSQVHKTVNTIYDRNNNGDFRVSQIYRVAELCNFKWMATVVS